MEEGSTAAAPASSGDGGGGFGDGGGGLSDGGGTQAIELMNRWRRLNSAPAGGCAGGGKVGQGSDDDERRRSSEVARARWGFTGGCVTGHGGGGSQAGGEAEATITGVGSAGRRPEADARGKGCRRRSTAHGRGLGRREGNRGGC
jgi:hypothetical protein